MGISAKFALFHLALKGQNISAQGQVARTAAQPWSPTAALGFRCKETLALKGRNNPDEKNVAPLQGLANLLHLLTQGGALGYYVVAPSGRVTSKKSPEETKRVHGVEWHADFQL